jgi:hypothetical protein
MTEERDPTLSRRYRELGAEEPPRSIDQAILAAAHRAADHAHAPLVAPAGRHRWYFAFGAAAILALAVAITVQVDRGPLDPEAVAPAAAPAERKESVADDKGPASRAQQPQEETLARLQKKPERPKPAPSTPARDSGQLREKPTSVETQSAPAAPPATPTPSQSGSQDRSSGAAAEVARTDRLEPHLNQAPAVQMQNAPAAAPVTPTQPQADNRDQSSAAAAGVLLTRPQAKEGRVTASIMPPLSPEQLLERIAELRKQGRHEEADKALAEFRKQYPDYRISEETLKKVERGK